jgi:hypothetical protein
MDRLRYSVSKRLHEGLEGLRCAWAICLSPGIPYETDFPFAVWAGNREYEVEVRGSYNAILALQWMVN